MEQFGINSMLAASFFSLFLPSIFWFTIASNLWRLFTIFIASFRSHWVFVSLEVYSWLFWSGLVSINIPLLKCWVGNHPVYQHIWTHQQLSEMESKRKWKEDNGVLRSTSVARRTTEEAKCARSKWGEPKEANRQTIIRALLHILLWQIRAQICILIHFSLPSYFCFLVKR